MRFMSDKHILGLRPEYFGLAWGKEAIGKLGVKPKLELLALGSEDPFLAVLNGQFLPIGLYGKKRNLSCI